jgi:hypothetical protein
MPPVPETVNNLFDNVKSICDGRAVTVSEQPNCNNDRMALLRNFQNLHSAMVSADPRKCLECEAVRRTTYGLVLHGFLVFALLLLFWPRAAHGFRIQVQNLGQ